MKRGLAVGVSMAAVVLAAGGATAWWLLSRPPSASDTVAAYFAALDRGNAAAALALTDAAADDFDVAAQALAAATARPASASIGETSESDGAASVAVTYSLDGDSETATVQLRRVGGRWAVTDGLATVSVTTTLGAAVTIGDVIVPATATDPGTVRLLPGRYVIGAAPSAVLTGQATADALPGADASVAVTASLSAGAQSAAQDQLDAYALTCTAPATAVPEHCGLRIPWAADLTTITRLAFRIEQTPRVALAGDGRSFAATGGVVVATATGAAREGGTASFTYRADDWALRGSVAFEPDAMVLAVR